MRRLIEDVYKIIFRISGNKQFSLICALVYISILNLVILYGICLLLEDWEPEILVAVKLFRFPYYIFVGVLMFLINFLVVLPLHRLRDKARLSSVTQVVLYSFVSLLLFLYSQLHT